MSGDGAAGIIIETLERHAQRGGYDIICWGWLAQTPVNGNCGKIVGGLINKGAACP